MATQAGTLMHATLYDAPDFQGAAVSISPDRWKEDGGAVVYSLARLGLVRLGSLRLPPEPDDPEHPLHQYLAWFAHVTVWASRPQTGRLDPEGRGTTWQQYDADTGDLGDWAARSQYVRVWNEEDGAVTDRDPVAGDGCPLILKVVE
ncbi:hypothetical protein [Streptomyces sp. NPDC051109]|uniref:hypothetical protein n=1 Tax=Streptomyces sp. NPDC051109 TaxID=3365642 RepID=UPI001064E377